MNATNTNTLAPFEELTLCFDSSLAEPQTFGVLRLHALSAPEVTTPLDFVFTVDCSGSMSDLCADHRTKMQHIVHTLQNMVHFLREQTTVSTFITVHAFDDEIYTIVPRVALTAESLEDVLERIRRIRPKDQTNLELALSHANAYIQGLNATHPVHHIFLTDGDATQGSSDHPTLQALVTTQSHVEHAYIGFGMEHDAPLLRALAQVGKGSYFVVDRLESAGLVYGELLHAIVYKALTDVELEVVRGQVYDFQTNTWVESLRICDVVSEANKTFHIRSDMPYACRVTVRGTSRANEAVELRAIHGGTQYALKKHNCRQKTLELMYRVNAYHLANRDRQNSAIADLFKTPMRKRDDDNDPEKTDSVHPLDAERATLHSLLSAWLDELKAYMDSDACDDKPFVKHLCDDVYVCMKTLPTRHGMLFSVARQLAQGSQRQYTATNVEDVEEDNVFQATAIQLGRNLRRRLFDENVSDDDEEGQTPETLARRERWELSCAMETPYKTTHATQVMRFVSNNGSSILTQKF